MEANLNHALLITVLGMGLVFGAILLLWALMAALVRLAADRQEPTPDQPTETALLETDTAALQMQQRAAAVAVAFALAREKSAGCPHEFPLPQTAVVSAWQAVNRSKMLNQRGSIR